MGVPQSLIDSGKVRSTGTTMQLRPHQTIASYVVVFYWLRSRQSTQRRRGTLAGVVVAAVVTSALIFDPLHFQTRRSSQSSHAVVNYANS